MWWFKRAAFHKAEPQSQIMHPWYLDYELVEEPIRGLVWSLNHTDLVETLSSCCGHPENEEWAANSRVGYVLYRVIRPSLWKVVLTEIQKASASWSAVELLIGGRREQSMAFQARPSDPERIRDALYRAYRQTETIVARHLDPDCLSLSPGANLVNNLSKTARVRPLDNFTASK
ncbi:MAG: hypothetical protein FJ320_04455 [SAR202 cluster bacterium]|nr:hypothetical protein [SAR202 cluster bacterium]